MKDIYKITAVFKFIGFWDDAHETTFRKEVKFFHFIFFVSYIISMAAGTFITNDETEIVFLASTVIGYSVHAVVFFHIIWRKTEILAFLQKVGPIIAEEEKQLIVAIAFPFD